MMHKLHKTYISRLTERAFHAGRFVLLELRHSTAQQWNDDPLYMHKNKKLTLRKMLYYNRPFP